MRSRLPSMIALAVTGIISDALLLLGWLIVISGALVLYSSSRVWMMGQVFADRPSARS